MMRPFNKPFRTYREQIELLKARGMSFKDEVKAEFHLSHTNYYRLSGYWLSFEADHDSHAFKPGTSFEEVIDLYEFDRKLRLIVLASIERVEVSVRANWAYHMAR